jgi:hypothetical protein
MKKLVILIALITIIGTGTAFADHPSGLGIGVVGSYWGGWGGGYAPGFALSLKLPSVPLFWGIGLQIHDGYFGLGVSGDKYLIDQALVKDIGLHWYLGLGGWVNLGFGNDWFGCSLGLRLPVGLSWQPIPLLELFLDIAPSLGVEVAPGFHFPAGGWQPEFGIRLWL